MDRQSVFLYDYDSKEDAELKLFEGDLEIANYQVVLDNAKTAVETEFNYTNTGDAPLVITDIKSSCGCTVPKDWSREPLAPGASGKFSVKFNGSGANKVTKTITVTANTEKGSEIVKISAFVKPEPIITK